MDVIDVNLPEGAIITWDGDVLYSYLSVDILNSKLASHFSKLIKKWLKLYDILKMKEGRKIVLEKTTETILFRPIGADAFLLIITNPPQSLSRVIELQ